MVAELMLAVWVVVAVGLFAVLSPTRAFVLTYVIGILILPVETSAGIGSIALTNSVRLDKFTACHLGAAIGTLLFAPQVVRRYRFDFFDGAFLATALAVCITSLVNALGAKDGLSNAANVLRMWWPLIVLTKMHVTDAAELMICVRAIIGGAVVYAGLAVAEFRLSPQTHRLIYGYFQHSFDQFARFDYFRPVAMLRHALEMSFFMGMAAVAALWLCGRGMLKNLWGWMPGWLVAATLLLGLVCTLTFSGYAAFLLGAAVLLALHFTRSRWVLWALPAVALLWMAGRYTGVIDAKFLVDTAAKINETRALSLQYRLDAEEMHLRAQSFQSALLGLGSFQGLARAPDGSILKAVDAFWLINMSFYGVAGLLGWIVVWSAGVYTAWRHWSRWGHDMQTAGGLIAVLLGLQLIDFLFNAFPSHFLMMLNFGLVSVALRLPRMAPARQTKPTMAWRPVAPRRVAGAQSP